MLDDGYRSSVELSEEKRRTRDPHAVYAHQLTISWAEWASDWGYSGVFDKEPPEPPRAQWHTPSAEEWECMESVAQHLLATPAGYSSGSADPVDRPPATASGIAASNTAERSDRGFFRILLSGLGGSIHEDKELTGNLRRKWVSTSFTAAILRGQCYIRVEDWPFKVTREVYDSLAEGDRVIVSFSARSKKVDRVAKLT